MDINTLKIIQDYTGIKNKNDAFKFIKAIIIDFVKWAFNEKKSSNTMLLT